MNERLERWVEEEGYDGAHEQKCATWKSVTKCGMWGESVTCAVRTAMEPSLQKAGVG